MLLLIIDLTVPSYSHMACRLEVLHSLDDGFYIALSRPCHSSIPHLLATHTVTKVQKRKKKEKKKKAVKKLESTFYFTPIK